MATTIVTKNGSGAPAASDLVAGELAVDLTNGRLYTEDSGGSVIEIGLNPSGNVDVTGTVTADGAEIIGDVAINTTTPATYLHIVPTDGELNDAFTGFRISRSTSLKSAQHSTYSHSGGSATITSTVTTGGAGGGFRVLSSADGSTTKTLANFANNNDISFYEDTGTTAKFFWDASAESLGIGTSSPFFTAAGRSSLSVNGTSSSILAFGKGGSSENYILADAGGLTIANTSATLPTAFFNNGSTRMTISSAGTVGIGMAPDANNVLSVKNTSGKVISLTNGVDADLYVDLTSGLTLVSPSTGTLAFGTSNTERMRLDSSGNLLVGKTASDYAVEGVEIRSNEVLITKSTTNPLNVRNGQNGGLIAFASGSSTVGSIGVASGDNFYIGATAANHTGLQFADNVIVPMVALSNSDATTDLGASTVRFKDLYRSGSTISTSDRNMKQDERDLTEAETRVAQACKGLLKAFRFIDAVQVDGDDARIHFGIIAQDLQAAFEAEGLDATKYAMFRPSTFTNDEGNEETRLGVCYENLLAFIIAAI